jgi:hypothetical protein
MHFDPVCEPGCVRESCELEYEGLVVNWPRCSINWAIELGLVSINLAGQGRQVGRGRAKPREMEHLHVSTSTSFPTST